MQISTIMVILQIFFVHSTVQQCTNKAKFMGSQTNQVMIKLIP